MVALQFLSHFLLLGNLLIAKSTLGEAIVIPVVRETLRSSACEILSREENRLAALSGVAKCLESIFTDFARRERVSVVLAQDNDDIDIARLFLPALQSKLATYVSSGANYSRSDGEYNVTRSALIVLADAMDLVAFEDPRSVCGPRCYYVLTMTALYETEEDFLRVAGVLLRLLQERSIVLAVIVASVGEQTLVAGTASFEPRRPQESSAPVVLATCTAIGQLDGRLWRYSMNNGTVNACYVENEPFVYPLDSDDPDDSVTGIEWSILHLIVDLLGATLDKSIVTLDNRTSPFEALKRNVVEFPNFDVAISGLHVDLDDLIEYTVPYEVERVVWLVPIKPSVSLLGLVTPFSGYVWAAIGLLTAVTALLACCLPVLRDNLPLLDLFALVLGVATARQPVRVSARIEFIAWALFGYVVTQCYLASLAGQLAIHSNRQIDTMAELVGSGLTLGGTDRYKSLFDDAEDATGRRIYDEFVVFEDAEYERLKEDVNHGRNSSVALVVEVKLSGGESRLERNHAHVLKETLARYQLALAVWKGLPYLEQMNERLEWLTEGGFVSAICKWFTRRNGNDTDYARDVNDDDNSQSTLGIEQLSPSFLLLLLGEGIGCLAFLVEIGVFPFRRANPEAPVNRANETKRGFFPNLDIRQIFGALRHLYYITAGSRSYVGNAAPLV